MNPNESKLHYPHADLLPAPGTTIEVAPGIKWLRMGLPFALDHINLWLLRDHNEDSDGWTIVDCGITQDSTKADWEKIFANDLEGLPVLRVMATHMHPDHLGLAHWLCERWSCRLWMSATDYSAAVIGSQSTTGFGGASAAAFFASHGLVKPESVDKIKARSNYYASMVPQVPRQFRRLLDGMTVQIGSRQWQCISGYGHAPEHIALYCEQDQILISGDMILPRISTNISVHDVEPESNPLALFLESIDKFKSCAESTLVLPSHGKPFVGLHERISQLHAHHQAQLVKVLAACQASPCSAADILPVLFKRPLDLHQTTFAMGEAIAHLHWLWFEGKVERVLGIDVIYRFNITSSTPSNLFTLD